MRASRLAAAAAKQVLEKSKQDAAGKVAEQAQQDPILQMQQQELGLKAKEVEIKEKKMVIDAAAKNDQMDIERERIAAQKEIAGLQVGAKIATDKANLSAKQQEAGLRIGVEIARETTQRAQTPTELPVSNAPPKENE